jgi:glucoamylase
VPEEAFTWPASQPPADEQRRPNWTSGAKDGVGTSASARSRVWFTIANGALTEVYYPRVDQANTRDLRFVVTDGDGYFSDELHDADNTLSPLEAGVPAYHVTSTCRLGRYRLDKTIITDDERAAVLIRVKFQALGHGKNQPLRLHVLLAPHVGNQGEGNDGWLGNYKGMPQLFASRPGAAAIAVASSLGFVTGACTKAGACDAWHELKRNGHLTNDQPHAFAGNLLLAAELRLPPDGGSLVVALAFGAASDDAGQEARAAVLQDFDNALASYVNGWHDFHDRCSPPDVDDPDARRAFQVSASMLRVHEDKEHSGALIASLAIPWGTVQGDHEDGGYHLVWPRDLVESAGGLIAAGHMESGRLALLYLMSTQENSGHWPQNMWLSGEAYWRGVQLDESGLPILLAERVARSDALGGLDPWPMVRRAAGYIVCNGPVTPEDRWEEEGGYSPYTLAVEIAALIAAAELAGSGGNAALATYLRETADYWNSCIERWCYVTDTDLARKLGLDGYYVRLAPSEANRTPRAQRGRQRVALKNHPLDSDTAPYGSLVSPDALALVRFGLRRADDPRVRNTVAAIDSELCSETATGPVWHRFTADGYGEHDDGSPYDGTGIGRGWPLLAGERAHYELVLGNKNVAERLRDVMVAQSSRGGLIPEQVWDTDDIPKAGLYSGRPSGSAMPLVWAHAEYVKLCRSLHDGRVFDMPPATAARYAQSEHPPEPRFVIWRANNKRKRLPVGKQLRVEHRAPSEIQWRVGDGAAERVRTTDSSVGVHYADLSTDTLPRGTDVHVSIQADHDGEAPPPAVEFVMRVEDPERA